MFAARVVANADLVEAVDALLEHQEIGEAVESHQVVAIAAVDRRSPSSLRPDRRSARARAGSSCACRWCECRSASPWCSTSYSCFVRRAAISRWRRHRRIGRNEADFAGHVIAGADQDERLGVRLVDADEERAARSLRRRRRSVSTGASEPMRFHEIRPPVLRQHHVEQRGVVVRPHRAAARTRRYASVKQFTGIEILDVQRVAFGTVGVGRVREVASVGTHVEAAEAEVVESVRERGFVEHRLNLVGLADRPARPDAVLRVVRVPPLVFVVRRLSTAPPLRRVVGALEFREQLLDQRLMRRHHRVEVGVLRFEVAEDLRIVDIGIARIAQPVVRIFVARCRAA